jgi:serine/tyrosine/threonine adenylyltransferase
MRNMDIPPSALVENRPADAAPQRVWNNRFHGLGEGFFTPMPPEPMPNPHWVATSPSCAALLDLPTDWAQRADLNALDVFSGNALWPAMRPLASVYSGHQFGVWAGQLGDGRALLLGELDTRVGPMELQLKGAGRTPYSRMGDGRAVLRSSIREYLCSEAMHALGVPTTRALCITGSALPVRREEIETAAVVTRVAPSFIRFGHFEHFAHHADAGHPQRLRALADFVIEHHFPSCREAAQPHAALLAQVAQRTALLMAHWQAVGFCHGVMNTDNMSILGLTIDYGPFGFLDAFDPGHICNHSDHQGRYAWARQPNVGFWNLHALGQALLPLIEDSDAALAAIETYKTTFADALLGHWRAKLGLKGAEADDRELADDLLRLMAADACDFTITFRRLAGFTTAAGTDNANVRDLFIDREAFDAWAARYTARLLRDAGSASSLDADAQRAVRMNRVNPKFVLRNHLVDVAIRQARAGDFSEIESLQTVLARPFDEHGSAETLRYAGFPPEWAKTIEVSCSS